MLFALKDQPPKRSEEETVEKTVVEAVEETARVSAEDESMEETVEDTIEEADAERVFSIVGLNKTKSRNSLALDGTLSSIMTVKMAGLEHSVSNGSHQPLC